MTHLPAHVAAALDREVTIARAFGSTTEAIVKAVTDTLTDHLEHIPCMRCAAPQSPRSDTPPPPPRPRPTWMGGAQAVIA